MWNKIDFALLTQFSRFALEKCNIIFEEHGNPGHVNSVRQQLFVLQTRMLVSTKRTLSVIRDL